MQAQLPLKVATSDQTTLVNLFCAQDFVTRSKDTIQKSIRTYLDTHPDLSNCFTIDVDDLNVTPHPTYTFIPGTKSEEVRTITLDFYLSTKIWKAVQAFFMGIFASPDEDRLVVPDQRNLKDFFTTGQGGHQDLRAAYQQALKISFYISTKMSIRIIACEINNRSRAKNWYVYWHQKTAGPVSELRDYSRSIAMISNLFHSVKQLRGEYNRAFDSYRKAQEDDDGKDQVKAYDEMVLKNYEYNDLQRSYQDCALVLIQSLGIKLQDISSDNLEQNWGKVFISSRYNNVLLNVIKTKMAAICNVIAKQILNSDIDVSTLNGANAEVRQHKDWNVIEKLSDELAQLMPPSTGII